MALVDLAGSLVSLCMVIRMPVHYSKLTSSDSLVSCILKSRSLTPGVLCVARGSGLLRQNTGCKFNTEIKLCYSTVVNSFTNAQRVATVTFIASPNFLSVPNYFCNTPYIWQLVSKKKYTRGSSEVLQGYVAAQR